MLAAMFSAQFAVLILVCTQASFSDASISCSACGGSAGFCSPSGTVSQNVWVWSCQKTAQQCYWKATSTAVPAPDVCCASYNGTNCDIPICNSQCEWDTGVKSVCFAPNSCFPTAWQGAIPCSSPNYCFPGLCSSGGCQCAAGFTGSNCSTIQQAPTMPSCSLSFSATGVPLTSSNCQTNGSVVFTRSGVAMAMSWRAQLLQTKDITNVGPPFPIHINNDDDIPATVWNVGIAQISSNVTTTDPSGTTKQLICNAGVGDTPATPPKSQVTCNPAPLTLDSTLPVSHGSTLDITTSLQAGGYVSVKFGQASATVRNFIRNTATFLTSVVIDNNRPSHCSESGACSLTDQPPIFHSTDDFSTVPLRSLGVFGWNDSDTAHTGLSTTINSYTFTLCPMAVNRTTGLLTEVASTCLPSQVYDLTTPGPLPSVTLTQTAMYSLRAAVCDRAANCAHSRRLIFFDKDKNIQTVTSSPIHLSDGGSTCYSSRLTGTLRVWWTGHFVNQKHSDMLSAVRPGQPGEFIFDAMSGNSTAAVRTLDPIPNMNGIISFAIGVSGTGRARRATSALQSVEGSQQNTVVTIPTGLGVNDTFTVTVQATDILNNTLLDTITVYFDTTSPTFVGSRTDSIKLETNIADPPANLVGLDVSRVRVFAQDTTSGIQSVALAVFDNSEGTMLPVNLTQSVFDVSPLLTADCAADTVNTYTTANGDCLSINQSAYIRHCDLYTRDTYILVIQVTLVNGAGLTTTDQITTPSLSNLNHNRSCSVQHVPPTTPTPTVNIPTVNNTTTTSDGGLSGGAIAGIVIGCVVGVVLIVLLIVFLYCYCGKRNSRDKGYEAGPRRADGTAAVVGSQAGVVVVDKGVAFDKEKSMYDEVYNKDKKANTKYEKDASGQIRYVTRD